LNIPEIITLSVNRVWRTYQGGRTLDISEGKSNPLDSHFPEDWIASTTRALNPDREHLEDEGYTYVSIEEKTIKLKSLMEQFRDKILGDQHFKKYGANSQFLLKYLDSAIRLHIQVHPTIEFSKKHLNSNSGKTEAYVILGIRDDVKEPYIYLGMQKPISRNDFKNAVIEQDNEKILSCFEEIPIKVGDVFIVPGGLPHAIGEGVFMIEIMEPTDFVARLEFKRGDYTLPEQARFMGRDIDFGIDMIDFEPKSIELVKQKYFCDPRLLETQNNSSESILIDQNQTTCFTVNRINIADTYNKNANSFYVGIVTKGNGTVISESQKIEIEMGDKFLIPFQTKDVKYVAKNELEIVIVSPPKS